ncbi:hypothetical protein [Burkholderia gladioli]|uniref:hypothetical protein n=1 Tax=Burkholderia gladioli TaxID=28095 RepID=UPI00163FD2CD|nr:hypothetical protein [Burkholderia gladioli]
MTTPLTDERRAALSSLITNWFSTLDADGRLIFEFDYFDVSKIDELIDQAIAPTIADAVECVRAASSAAGAELPPFPTMLRKMWSGGDVQRWIDQNIAPLVRNAAPPAADVSAAPGAFRKKPVIIEAHQLPRPPLDGSTNESHEDAVWAFVAWAKRVAFENFTSEGDGHIAIETLEGTMIATPGDWIIKGVKGEFYPCKPDIFAATYEPADAAPAAPVAAAAPPSLADACEVLRDAVAAKSMLAIGMVHGLASFAKGDAATAMRPETTSEHIARDIREGRFPKQSEPQMVPVDQAVAANSTGCKGKNCGATDGVSHSPECLAEYEAAVTGAVAADGASDFSAWLATKSEAWWEDTSLEKIAEDAWNASRAAVSPAPTADMSDAYVGAREDLAIWKRRALEAEGKVEQLADARKLLAHASEFAMMQLDEDWHERAAALLALPPPAGSASAPPAHCQCPACSGGTTHASDCAVHNEPAMPRGPCDCAPGGKHHGCEYFVLDLQHDVHAGAALAAYARSCSTTHPALSADLLARAAALGAPVAVDEWVSKADALPAAPGWYLVMLAPDNDWELMSDTPIQVEFGAYKHMPQAFTHFYDGRPDEDITEAVTYWTRLPAPPRPAAPAAVEFSYALSQHAERWSGSFDSIEGALAEALSGLDDAGKRDRVIWVGQDKPIDIDYDSLAEEVIERIQEQAFDQVGEVADVIGPYEETETKLLSLAIKRWIDEHGQISCYRIDHSIAYGPGAPEYESAIALLRERDGSAT